ncbi:hypothetical protein [Cryptosporangium sp. NPDC051539]|uniref:hypothetical protein n=1 Tax=Cryptosporangium sp. NPDC051539 TaxID=3363962 RepID=UPI00379D1584
MADRVNDRLLNDKKRRGRTRAPLRVAPVPEFEKLGGYRTGGIQLDLLHGLGRTTSALPGLRKAGTAGLPGLSALRLSSQWAIARYLWLFADEAHLRLSELTEEVRRHQRAVLSEHLGIALATDLVELLLVGSDFRVVDGDAVRYDPYLEVLEKELGAERPDYYWYRVVDNEIGDLAIVEANGSKSSSTSIGQLARGARQVSLPAALQGVRTRRIVIGASATPSGYVRVTAVELSGEIRSDDRGEIVAELHAPDAATELDEDLIAYWDARPPQHHGRDPRGLGRRADRSSPRRPAADLRRSAPDRRYDSVERPHPAIRARRPGEHRRAGPGMARAFVHRSHADRPAVFAHRHR